MGKRWALSFPGVHGLSAVMLLAACGDDSGQGGGGGGASDGRIELEELCSVYLDDICTVLIECLDAPYCSVEECKKDRECEGIDALLAEVDAGWVSYDPAAAAECHASFAAAPCDFGGFFFLPSVPEVLAVCPGVLSGAQGAGDPCASEADCGEDFDCVDDACPGTCTAWLTEGDACVVGMGASCDPRADLSCENSVCRGPWMLGDACASAADCFPDLWCDLTAGACVELSGDGDPCSFGGGGAAPRCADGLWCDSLFDVGACHPLSGAGGACLYDTDCIEGLTCLPTTGLPDPGECGDVQPDGAACDSFADCTSYFCDTDTCAPSTDCSQGAPCGDGEICDGTECVARACEGAPCADGTAACGSGICKNGSCTPRAALGAACGEDDDCASRHCDSGVCADLSCTP